MAPEIADLAGTAAAPRITAYRPNGPGSPADRSLASLLAWAAARGVTVPEWCAVRVVPDEYGPEVGGRPVRAAYFSVSRIEPDRVVRWRPVPGESPGRSPSVVAAETGKVPIRIRESASANDEEFLHLLAHEAFEVRRMREEFEAVGGSMTAAAVHELTRADRRLNNPHSEAWDHADAVLERLRAAPDPPAGERA